ncbi:transposase [Amycolatopsis sp. A24]|uniref:transposase n=1 Tax=Amycolatopsis bullii TaxID=941987 RepID=UPI0035714CC3
MLTDVGPLQVDVPWDRDASFEPKIVTKREKRLGGVDEMVISLARISPASRSRFAIRGVILCPRLEPPHVGYLPYLGRSCAHGSAGHLVRTIERRHRAFPLTSSR